MLKQHMESSITVIAGLKKQMEALCNYASAMKQASEQKKLMLEMTSQVGSANQQLTEVQLKLKKEKLEPERECEQKNHEINDF
jgi:hypothetical protein